MPDDMRGRLDAATRPSMRDAQAARERRNEGVTRRDRTSRRGGALRGPSLRGPWHRRTRDSEAPTNAKAPASSQAPTNHKAPANTAANADKTATPNPHLTATLLLACLAQFM